MNANNASARSRKHLCSKQTCKGCPVCADPGARGECGPCSRNITSTVRAPALSGDQEALHTECAACGEPLYDGPAASPPATDGDAADGGTR